MKNLVLFCCLVLLCTSCTHMSLPVGQLLPFLLVENNSDSCDLPRYNPAVSYGTLCAALPTDKVDVAMENLFGEQERLSL